MSQIDTKEIQLHNGVVIPTLGYRVDKDHGENNYERILSAINVGFRHFDISPESITEKAAGRAFQDSKVNRSELFITAKLDNDNHGYQQALREFDHTLKRLQTDYVDLFLINWPNPSKYRDTYEETAIETWKALETIYKEGNVSLYEYGNGDKAVLLNEIFSRIKLYVTENSNYNSVIQNDIFDNKNIFIKIKYINQKLVEKEINLNLKLNKVFSNNKMFYNGGNKF